MEPQAPQKRPSGQYHFLLKTTRFSAECLKNFNYASRQSSPTTHLIRFESEHRKMLANVTIAGVVQRRLERAFQARQVVINGIVHELFFYAF